LHASSTPRENKFREFPDIVLFAAIFLCTLCTACGTVGSGPAPDPPAPKPVSVTVTPVSAQSPPGGRVQFTAVVQNAQTSAVIWQVNGNAERGTIDSTGLYTAPNTVPNPGTVTVTAVSQANLNATASATVTIQGALSISPSHSSFSVAQPVQLSVVGADNSAVIWAVDRVSGGNATVGTVSNGLYTPPSAVGSHEITATLIMDASISGSATVAVTGYQGTLTWRNDISRSGINNQELALTPGNVSPSTFGKLFSCPIDGHAYAQPLYVPNLSIAGKTHNVVIVATEKDSVFAFDADTSPCTRLWQRSLIPVGSQAIEAPNLQITSTDITPFIGITGTPVVSLATSALYVVAATQTILPLPGTFTPGYSSLFYALDLATGQPEIQPFGVAPFVQPELENQRPALLLDNGTVYVGFGSYGGQGDYHGWLFGYDSSTLQQTGAFNVTPDTPQGGIWQSGGGPSADVSHDVFVTTGDGGFNAYRGLNSYGNSFLRLGTIAGLTVSDYFTPCNEPSLESPALPALPLDVGASAPVLLPDTAGSSLQPHLLLGGSKAGVLYVVNRDNMGKYTPVPPLPPPAPPCSDSSVGVQSVSVGSGPILSTPLFWNNSVYVAPGNGNLMAFPMAAGIVGSMPSATNSNETLGPQGATPAISWNASSDLTSTSTAVLWLIDTSGALAGAPAILRAYDPNNLSDEIYNSTTVIGTRNDNAGPAVKFTVPTVANGKVYVGTQTKLDVYGFLQ
jgi:hypothetical protein